MAQQNGTPKNNVARRLFQDHDDDESIMSNDLENQANQLLDRSLEEAKARWNFDFKNGVPLDGDWMWEKVEETEEEARVVAEASKENRNPNA